MFLWRICMIGHIVLCCKEIMSLWTRNRRTRKNKYVKGDRQLKEYVCTCLVIGGGRSSSLSVIMKIQYFLIVFFLSKWTVVLMIATETATVVHNTHNLSLDKRIWRQNIELRRSIKYAQIVFLFFPLKKLLFSETIIQWNKLYDIHT